MSKDTVTWTYTYDANGMRTSRTNGTTTYNYVYNGSQLTQMTVGTDTLCFTYDASGIPTTVTLNGVVYYYITNMQGDVVGIYTADGTSVCYYNYDAWGRPVTVTNDDNYTIDDLNPLRYRGYVFDQNTGLYYLQSRYYNPEWGRFINADAFISTGQGILGNNMFAYCLNNPVSRQDAFGLYSLAADRRLGDSYSIIVNPVGFGSCGGGDAAAAQNANVLLSVTVTGTVISIGYDQYEKTAKKTRILADVKVKKQPDDKKLYQLAYVNEWGFLIKVGKKMTFTEAMAVLGISGAVNMCRRKRIRWHSCAAWMPFHISGHRCGPW